MEHNPTAIEPRETIDLTATPAIEQEHQECTASETLRSFIDVSTHQQEPKRRYGYRQDSPPEVIALLHDAQNGSAESFANIYRLHAARLTRYVSARTPIDDRDAIPDIVQDAFCEAFADLPNAHHDVKGWLLSHAAKAFIRHARATAQQGKAELATREALRTRSSGRSAEFPVEAELAPALGRTILPQALARLTPRERRCIQYRHLEGQTQATTAALLGGKLSGTKTTEYRALAKLREMVGKLNA